VFRNRSDFLYEMSEENKKYTWQTNLNVI
jgi:hypothetical protein